MNMNLFVVLRTHLFNFPPGYNAAYQQDDQEATKKLNTLLKHTWWQGFIWGTLIVSVLWGLIR